MKAAWFVFTLLLLVNAGVFQLPAQQSGADHKSLADIRTKAEDGDADAQYSLGRCYANGEGVKMDAVEAVKWFRQASEQGNASAQRDLGICYYVGQGVAEDKIEAVKWYRKAADQNDAKAHFNLGICYAKGEGVAKDYVEAVKWFRKAAEQNIAAAQYNLGICYVKGDGVAKNEHEAAKWFRQAAEQDYADAQCELGSLYLTGLGVEKDVTAAAVWYRKAADNNNPKAQYNLGHLYADGEGVTKDAAEAVNWYRKAAEQGYADAQFDLGVVYGGGKGVPQDYAEAVNWLRKAADQGVADAQFNLGNKYALGQGLKEDLGEAIKWYRKAADQGHTGAHQNLRVIDQNTKAGTNAPPEYRKATPNPAASTQTTTGQAPDGEQKRLHDDVYYADAEARYWQAQLEHIKAGRTWQPVLSWDKDGNPVLGEKQQPTEDAARRVQLAMDSCLQIKEKKQKQIQQLSQRTPQPSALQGAKKSNRRPFTQQELQALQADGYDMSTYHGEEVDFPPQPAANASPTPNDLKNAVIWMDSFLGMTKPMIRADVISMKPEALQFRFNGRDYDYSGHYQVMLKTPRRHRNPYLGLGSPETAKLVILEDGRLLKYLQNATIWEKSNGFIVLVALDKEWIYSGPYSIQK